MQSFDLNLLPVAQALLRERSVTRAAARLHLSVPATSRALDRCRAAFGDELLVRAGRGLDITPRGLALLPELDRALASIEQTVCPPAEIDPAKLRATFSARANEAILAILAGPWLEVIAELAPGVRLRFEGEASDDIEVLRKGDISLAVGSYSGLTEDIHHEHLIDEQLVGVLRPDHPLAGAPMTTKRFAGLGHVAVSRRGITRGPLDDALGAAGLTRDVVAVVPSFAAAIGMCLTSDFTTLAPRRLVDALGGSAAMASFDPPVPVPIVRVAGVWHARHHADPAHQWLRRSLAVAVDRASNAVRAPQLSPTCHADA